MTDPSPAVGGGSWLALLGFLLAAFSAAGIGSFFTVSEVPGWYKQLAKPTWTPPGWVFGPVWSALYTMIGLSAWLTWKRIGLGWNLTWSVFAVQLTLNALWSILFFGRHSPGWALVDIIFLWAAIVMNTMLFWRVDSTAGALFIPYLLWVSFASALNASIWQLNR